jgi:hypothetical protein
MSPRTILLQWSIAEAAIQVLEPHTLSSPNLQTNYTEPINTFIAVEFKLSIIILQGFVVKRSSKKSKSKQQAFKL